jgi:RNA polymerase sigma-70 factor (ECF subfamily)
VSDLSRTLLDARAAWPGVELSSEVFHAWLCERDDGGEALHTGDLYLACACVHHVPGALAMFERSFMSRIPAFLAGLRPTPQLVEEVSQQLRERLLLPSAGRPPRLATYSGRGSLAAWLCVTAVRTAMDALRSPSERASDPVPPDLELLGEDPAMAYLKNRYRGDVDEALRAGFRALSARQRLVLELHLVEGLSLDEIGAMHRISKSSAFRWVSDARQQVLAEARRILEDKLGVTADEFASLVNLVRSQLDLSLSRILARAEPPIG